MPLFVLLLVLAASACAPAPSAPDATPPTAGVVPLPGSEGQAGPFASEADYQTQREAAMSALTTAVGEARASSATACRTVPVGAKACGGPQMHLVYSSSAANEAEVTRLAERVTALDRQANEQFNLMSDCMMLMEPQTTLEGGRCVAR